jgi:SAM-dependent methyltransferase
MDKETAKKILQKTTEDYKKISKEFIQTRIKPWAVFDKFKKYVKDNDKVLDVGCGGGRLIEIFKGADVEYVGFDTSEEAIDSARNTYGSFFKISPKFIIHDIVDFPWPWTGESFDVVFVVAVLHHIPSKEFRQDVLKEIKRVLKPGGKLIMTNWNLRSIWAIKKFWPEILRLIFPRKDLDRGDFFAPWKLKSG